MEAQRPTKRARVNGPRKQNKSYRGSGSGKISSAGIQNGDVGIFVTCDMGMEKRCLREVEDLLDEYMSIKDGSETNPAAETTAHGDSSTTTLDVLGGDIEADILAELAEMQNSRLKADKSNEGGSGGENAALGLVTLDIPCVSFVRFPSTLSVTHDPVYLVHKICTDAAEEPDRPRSRFIKRLTPVSVVRKVLSGGIETLCEEVLPRHFDGEGDGCKYAIRPTIRNNNQANRDQVIRTIAERVEALGGEEKKYKVDLKGYDKLILIDVYQNVCGMSVVGADYERLKRFNLAEIYAAGRTVMEDKAGTDSCLNDSLDKGKGLDGGGEVGAKNE